MRDAVYVTKPRAVSHRKIVNIVSPIFEEKISTLSKRCPIDFPLNFDFFPFGLTFGLFVEFVTLQD